MLPNILAFGNVHSRTRGAIPKEELSMRFWNVLRHEDSLENLEMSEEGGLGFHPRRLKDKFNASACAALKIDRRTARSSSESARLASLAGAGQTLTESDDPPCQTSLRRDVRSLPRRTLSGSRPYNPGHDPPTLRFGQAKRDPPRGVTCGSLTLALSKTMAQTVPSVCRRVCLGEGM